MNREAKHIQPGYTTVTPYLRAKLDLIDFLRRVWRGGNAGFATGLGAGALREPADQPWGDRMAGVKDSLGDTWWIATH